MAREDAGGVMAGDEAVAHAVEDRLPQGPELDTVGQADGEALPQRGRGREPQLVGNQLDHVAGTERPALDDGPEMLKHRPSGTATAAGSPPTNRVSSPRRAPSTAPVTGASTAATPSGAAEASPRTSSRLLVVRSTQTDPGLITPSAPLAPAMAASTWGGPGNDVINTSASRAQSPADSAASAPASTAAAIASASRS